VHNKRKTLFIIAAIVSGIVVLTAGAIPLIISIRYEQVIKRKLPEWVAKETDGLYHISVKDIDISTFSKNVTITGVTLQPDSMKLMALKETRMLPKTVFNASISKIQVKTIHWANLLDDKELSCDQFIIDHPSVIITQSDPSEVDTSVQLKKSRIERLSANLIRVTKSRLEYRNSSLEDSIAIYWSGGNMEIKNWIVDPRQPDDKHQFFYAESGTIEVDSLVYNKHHSLYAFRAENIHFISKENSMVLNNLSIVPAMSREEYYRRVGHREEIISLSVPALELQGFNWQQISSGKLFAQAIIARNPKIDVYLNRLLPPAPFKAKLFPVQQLQKARLPVKIDTLRVVNATVNYTELSNVSKKEATVPFRVFNAGIYNITNIPGSARNNDTCIARLNVSLFGSIITSVMKFPLTDTTGAFNATALGTPFDGKKISVLTEPLALMQIQSLNLHKAQFSIATSGQDGQGHFLFLYDDLDLKILKVAEDGSFDGKGLMSFIMNKALLYPANPMPGTPVRQVNVSLQREPDQSFFNFLWMSIRKGALLTAGRNPQLAKIAEQ